MHLSVHLCFHFFHQRRQCVSCAARFNTGSFSGRRFNQNLPEEGSGEEEQPQQHPLDSEVSHDVSPTSASEPAMRSSSSANRSQHLSHSSTGVSKGHDAMLVSLVKRYSLSCLASKLGVSTKLSTDGTLPLHQITALQRFAHWTFCAQMQALQKEGLSVSVQSA